MPDGEISIDDPRAVDVRELLARHLAFASSNSPPEDVHALDVESLLDPAVRFFSFRLEGELLAVAALRGLDARHAELKSMHTAEAARGRGIGRAMVEHLLRYPTGPMAETALQTLARLGPADEREKQALGRYIDAHKDRGQESALNQAVYVCLHVSAFDEAERQLTDWARRKRAERHVAVHGEGG